ncbi:hypothetical protein CSA80_03995 [Candidatus Saccharibacteria bacterium]|nr:MAG: hypothetical protein CR973_00090 [Candidatus Saccharibacteria bacterium]PID98843.1 MAG: hypothetical protein CSA80_03995 [Candidatus Saccharibacteria bacterium]
MPANTTPKPDALLRQLQRDFPALAFVASSRFAWSSENQHISYEKERLSDVRGVWAIFHELGHALSGHTDYESDVQLLHMEIAAWEKAHELAARYHAPLDQNYVEDCLDSYRNWLHVRATCPTCFEQSLQTDHRTYRCHNCGTEWHVTRARLCRPYRRKK